MSGHSRWAGIKHKKGAADKKKGKLFTKLVRELTISAKEGGGVPENNPRLRKAIDDARAANMPQDNVKKAIARGTGEIPGVNYEDVVYEGYGPGGVAVLCVGTTDNRNRTSSDIRKIFSDHNGNLGESGCVAWMFEKKGYLVVEKSAFSDEEKLMNLAIDAGSDDFKSDDSQVYEIVTAPEDFDKVKGALESSQVPLASSEVTMLPKNYVQLSGSDAENMVALMEELEEHDDTSNIYANCTIDQADVKA